MFNLFRRKKVLPEDGGSSKLSVRIVACILKIQLRWSKWMGRLFSRLTLRKQRIVLIGFIVLAGGYSIWVCIAGFVVQPAPLVPITSIQQPKYVTSTGDSNVVRALLPKKELAAILSFKKYIDSLSKSEGGRLKLDSIKVKRPGLLDSVEKISILYKIKL